jgi:transcriptional regulator with GAF, ATPase, and Fis domain
LSASTRTKANELAQTNTLISALSRMGQYVTASLDLTEVLYRVINEAQTLLGVDAISVLLRESPEELTFVAASGESAGKLINLHIPSGAGVAGKVIQTGQPILINDESGHELIYRNVDTATGYHTESC